MNSENAAVIGTALTLKNLYRLLTQADYPVYSLPVLSAKERKQLTLFSFWSDNLIFDFQSGPYGKMIWRKDSGTNRNLSYICNRTKADLYSGYLPELLGALDNAHLQAQADRFCGFLQQHSYNREVFRSRCAALPDALAAGDPLVSASLGSWLKTAFAQAAALPQAEEGSAAFQDALVFTVLTVLALAGTELPPVAAVLMTREDLQLPAMWKSEQSRQQVPETVAVLTVSGTEIYSRPLPAGSFFGREAELFDLLEAVRNREKILLTGIGGIGKTELLRQLLQTVLQEKTVAAVAAVPFRGTLAGSVAMSCPQPGFSAEEIFRSLIVRLNRMGDGKNLFLADNVAASALSEEDIDALLSLKGAVILSSRDLELRGFRTYSVGAVSRTAGELIYRSVYNAPMSAEERQELRTLLQREPVRHTLALRALATTAKVRKLSVRQAFSLFPEEGSAEKESSSITDSKLFRQLYRDAGLTKDEKTVAHLFALLPYLFCSEAELLSWFPSVLPEAGALHTALTGLHEGGWLESDSSGWAMHPVIAGSLRKKSYSEAELQPVLQVLTERYCRLRTVSDCFNADDNREKYIARSVYSLAAGKPGSAFIWNHMMLSSRKYYPRNLQPAVLDRFYRQISACPDNSGALLMLLCFWNDRGALPTHILSRMTELAENGSGGTQNALYQAFLEALAGSFIFAGQIEQAKHILSLSDPAEQDGSCRFAHLENEFLLFNYTGDASILETIAESVDRYPLPEGATDEEFAGFISLKVQVMLTLGNPAVFDLVPDLQARLGTAKPGNYRIAIEFSLSQLLFNMSRYEETMTMLTELIGYEEEYGSNFAELCSLKRNYAICLSKTGHNTEAAAVYEELLATPEMKSIPVQWYALQQNYAMLLVTMGRAAEALPILEQLLELYKDKPGIARANMLRSLAICCKALKKRKAEKNYLRLALPEIRACYGADSPRTAELEAMAKELGMEMPISEDTAGI